MAIFSRRKDVQEEVRELQPVVVAVAEPVEMPLPSLKREEPSVSSTDLSSELFSKAESLLGYAPQQKSQDAVKRAFEKLGFTPLDYQAVQAYQQAACQKVQQTLTRSQLENGWGTSWFTVTLSNYKKPIPEFALSHAVALKELLPEASFYVQELHTFHDPFMTMLYRNEWYFVDVWDEPTFEGRATV